MSGNIKDITGNKYGRLTVIGFDHQKGNRTYWKCKCDCGNECVRRKDTLTDKKTISSCGCYQKEVTADIGKKAAALNRGKSNESRKTHGDSKTRFYNIYHGAKARCENPNDTKYYNYGAKGIKFEWNSYEEFKKDMYESYLDHCEKYGEKNTTIDRIDPSKNYCKENCRWATLKEQANNKKITIYVEMEDGTLYPLAVFSEKFNINIKTLDFRYRNSKYYGTHRIPYKEIIKDKDIV